MQFHNGALRNICKRDRYLPRAKRIADGFAVLCSRRRWKYLDVIIHPQRLAHENELVNGQRLERNSIWLHQIGALIYCFEMIFLQEPASTSWDHALVKIGGSQSE
jgi:hypothetical protein